MEKKTLETVITSGKLVAHIKGNEWSIVLDGVELSKYNIISFDFHADFEEGSLATATIKMRVDDRLDGPSTKEVVP